mmetsp:Transcript_3417/g.14379  ORF Transcript_3417/g.14379 Transcript_3417/m.14379 type:complete len:285 (+) Transcript_3417:53-907(+)
MYDPMRDIETTTSILELRAVQLEVLVHLVPELLELRAVAVAHVFLEAQRLHVPRLDDVRGRLGVVLRVEPPDFGERFHQIPLVRALERPVLELPRLPRHEHRHHALPIFRVARRHLIRDPVLHGRAPFVPPLDIKPGGFLVSALVVRVPSHQSLFLQKPRGVVHVEQHLTSEPRGHEDDGRLSLGVILARFSRRPRRASRHRKRLVRPALLDLVPGRSLRARLLRRGELGQNLAVAAEEARVLHDAEVGEVAPELRFVELARVHVLEPRALQRRDLGLLHCFGL